MSENARGTPQALPAGLNALEKDISNTRGELAATLAELTNHVKPSELSGRAGEALETIEVRVRAAVRVELEHAKGLLHEELQVAKALVHTELGEAKLVLRDGISEAKTLVKDGLDQAEEKLKRGAIEAKDGFKAEVQAAFTGAKKDLRAATLGRVETLATDIGDTMNETSKTLMETVRNNPIPAAMVGAGVVWLLMSRSRAAKASAGGMPQADGSIQGLTEAASSGIHKATDAVGSAAHDAKEFAGRAVSGASEAATDLAHKASDAASSIAHSASDAASGLAHKASDAASSIAHGASDAASSAASGVSAAASAVGKGVTKAATFVGEGARTGAQRVGTAYQDTLRDNPLVLGGAAVVVGVALGLALPRTGVEDSMLGPSRDRLLARAGEAAHDAAGSVAHLAEQGVEAASTALRADGSP